MAYIYKHIKKDTKEIFYIGIGIKKNRKDSYASRNEYWHNITNKHGFISEIIEDNLTWLEACNKEKYWISIYGRKNNGTGILVNMTDGGEGTYGRTLSSLTKEKISKSHLGKQLSEEHKRKISKSNLNKPKPKPLDFGKKMSEIVKNTKRTEESKQKQSITTKQTLSKIKDKLREKSMGIKNSNSVLYVLKNKLTNETVELVGYKTLLSYYNIHTNQNKKDGMYLLKRIKENQDSFFTFIKSIKLNSK